MFYFNRYGLLGPSGCGKSTLLQCILGTKALDHGYIDLKAKRLNEVGYMPQVYFQMPDVYNSLNILLISNYTVKGIMSGCEFDCKRNV